MRKESANSDRFVAQIAARQHGVVSISQLLDAGLSYAGVTRRVKNGRLHRVHRGVYAVGHTSLSFEGRCLAAALSCGPRAAVSHRSAASLWRILSQHQGSIEVTISTVNGRSRRDGIRMHRSTLDASTATRKEGIAVTRPTRTLKDLRRTVPYRLYLRAVRRALDLGLISEADLRAETERTRSELERRMLALCRRHGLPTPRVNTRIGHFEVDFLWIEHALIVETDSFRFHRNRIAFESDRARDAELQAHGYRVVRFTYRQLEDRPREVVDPLRRVMGL